MVRANSSLRQLDFRASIEGTETGWGAAVAIFFGAIIASSSPTCFHGARQVGLLVKRSRRSFWDQHLGTTEINLVTWAVSVSHWYRLLISRKDDPLLFGEGQYITLSCLVDHSLGIASVSESSAVGGLDGTLTEVSGCFRRRG